MLTEHPVFKGYFADLETGEVYYNVVNKQNKNGELRKAANGVKKSSGYRMCKISNKNINTHKFIYECYLQKELKLSTMSGNGLTINHINEDKSDNRISNLEIITHRQNGQLGNIKLNRSGCRGVSWNNRDNKWVVSIRINTKKTYIGAYEIYEEAVKVAKATYLKYFNEVIEEY